MPVLETGSPGPGTGFAVPALETGKAGAGLPTGFAVPVLETGSPGPAGFAGTAKGCDRTGAEV